ncbi:MAG: hypothetical protein K8R68_11945 [Bacteroidales bacterium]|nr:hypothetical protein [Bacteroidales bacterium]
MNRIKEFPGKRSVKWRSPSNIALIKYWGKRDFQLPQNPSLSFTLKKSYTETEVEYQFKSEKGISSIRTSYDFFFEGKEKPEFKNMINKYLENLTEYLPFLQNLNLIINSRNSFPHSSGIASSASAMSALALCLCSIEQDLFGTLKEEKEFYEKSSFLARLGSGSASRSVYRDFVVWGKDKEVINSSDEIGVPLGIKPVENITEAIGSKLPTTNKFKTCKDEFLFNGLNIHPNFENLHDSILIISSETKKVSSSQGHNLMNDHPYATARYNQAQNNLKNLINALKSGDEQSFTSIVENEALSLHALMLSSQPGFTLLNEKSWEIIYRIRSFRESTGTMVCFTLDAGPNVHVLYSDKYARQVKEFIKSDLLQFCENEMWIDDEIGKGPFRINELLSSV